MTDAWMGIRSTLGMPLEGPTNSTEWTLARHVAHGAIDHVALRWRPGTGSVAAFTYGEIDRAASRFASSLVREGLVPGDTVAILTGRIPELVVSLLGSLRAGCVPTVLFSSFGPAPVQQRISLSHAKTLVTTARLYGDKVAPVRGQLPELDLVLIVDVPGRLAGGPASQAPPEGTHDFEAWLAQGDPAFTAVEVGPDGRSLLHFTSGTTGEAKGVVHAHESIVAHAHTGRVVLGLSPETRYWCTADPGWVTGVSYGILAPFACGSTVFMDEEEFEAGRWWENLATEAIEVLYTSPTALRLLRTMDAPAPPAGLPHLRAVFSVGEPLTDADASWATDAFGAPVYDTWWQTETGAIVIATPLGETRRPGRIGTAVEGYEVACLAMDTSHPQPVAAGQQGELAVRAPWPSMFRAYLDHPDLYASSFRDGWYLSGDIAVTDEQGWISYQGRRDDLFKSAGHLVSPAEVEVVLLAHDAVADAAVWGLPDTVAGTVIEAHVTLSAGHTPSDVLRQEILAWARERLGPALSPRSLHFRGRLPRTPSGKLLRRELTRSLPSAVHAVLCRVVPAAPPELDPVTPFRDQFEMDSLDFLNFVLALEKDFHIEIPAAQYPACASLGGATKVVEEQQR